MGCGASSFVPNLCTCTWWCCCCACRLQAGSPEREGDATDVLFFPDDKLPCKFHFAPGGRCSQGTKCKFSHEPTSLSHLLGWLDNAKRSLDICVFCICSDLLAERVLNARARGVRVRVITDDSQAKHKSSSVPRLVQEGVEVRHDAQPFHSMHHKFCIIDGRVLLNGSYNWTHSGTQRNQENCSVIHTPHVVAEFSKQFELLWAKYAGAKHTFQQQHFSDGAAISQDAVEPQIPRQPPANKRHR